MPYPMTDAERRYLAYDLPDDLAHELFDIEIEAAGCGCAPGKPACITGKGTLRSLVGAAYLPLAVIGIAVMVAFYASVSRDVVLKLAALGTMFLS